PDGKWAAWTWYQAGPTADVYVTPTDGSAAPTRLTDTPEDTQFVSWAPDSRAVIGAARPRRRRARAAVSGRCVAARRTDPADRASAELLHSRRRTTLERPLVVLQRECE